MRTHLVYFFSGFPELFTFIFFMSLKIALTGGIACGKSMAEACFRTCGCRVLDADAVVHQLEARGGAAVQPIVGAFGNNVLSEDGGIDRVALGKRVFADDAARKKLEAIVLPLVRQTANEWLKQAQPHEISVFSAALLYECGWEQGWDGVVCVVASPETQRHRMCRVRGMSPEDADARLAAQMRLTKKMRRANWILTNDTDDLFALQRQVETLVKQWQTLSNESH